MIGASDWLGGGLSGRKIVHNDIFQKIIGLENLFSAWCYFSEGKWKKADVLEFRAHLENNIFQLHRELKNKSYRHSHYTAFNVCDPKLRLIHKACVRDRVLHHAIFRVLYPLFDSSFIFDSYSCRMDKGTHRAVERLEAFSRKISRNHSRNILALKCDVRKFFASVDQEMLLEIIRLKIKDNDALWLIEKIIKSFPAGLPLGNVTSQLFSNIYLNELDQFVKHILGEKYYLRYCDDFIILAEDERYLQSLIPKIDSFLQEKLKLKLHPRKISIRKCRQGVDFLGYVVLPHYRVLRTKTKRRMLNKIKGNKFLLKEDLISKEYFNQSLQSYLGILKHCEGYKLKRKIGEIISEKFIYIPKEESPSLFTK